jgi:DNA-binding CsgD family transcriptional regulator
MAQRIPTVRNGYLKDLATNGNLAESIVVGTAEWFAWLEHHCSFRLETDCTAFTARKEQRPGGWYWYAYRCKQGKLRSAYLGKSKELTLVRLSSVAEVFERTHKRDGSASTSALHLYQISRDHAMQVYQASFEDLSTTITKVEQIRKPSPASKRLSTLLQDVEKSPLTLPEPLVLTGREQEVLCLLTMGLTSAQIAERLIVSLSTVNTHVRSIYNKLKVTSRSAATRYAIEYHLI